jgi:hypothetical protein
MKNKNFITTYEYERNPRINLQFTKGRLTSWINNSLGTKLKVYSLTNKQ